MKKLFIAGVAAPMLLVIAGIGMVAVLFTGQGSASANTTSLKGVPTSFQPWIDRASQQCQYPELTPALLAAQLNQESGFRTNAKSKADAVGPAQFTPASWATWGRDANGDGSADPTDIADAVMAQGRYMCSLIGQAKSSGIPGDPRSLALAGYNAGWDAVQRFHGIPPYAETQHYVTAILTAMSGLASAPDLQINGTGLEAGALRKAAGELGVPYSYGGGTPTGPSNGYCDRTNGYLNGRCVADTTSGFDCSSLTQYAYWPAVQLPRTAADQYDTTSSQPVARANLQPGDLMFWSHGGDTGIYHVALYAGNNQMLEAPRTGSQVKLAPLTDMPTADYYGATRP